MHEEFIKIGEVYSLNKLWVKSGKTSDIVSGTNRKIILAKKPTVGEPIMAFENSDLKQDHNEERAMIEVSTKILYIHKIKNVGLNIETETSLLLLVKKKH